MSGDPYGNAIRRALIPPDQADFLAQIPGWGPAQYGDDFTPLDAEDDSQQVDHAGDGAEHDGTAALEDAPEETIQATGGFLDLQEAPQFKSPPDEEDHSPSRADSYNEAFDDGTEALPVETQPPAVAPLVFTPTLRFDDFQPMTQDPGFDSLLPLLPETAPQGLTQDAAEEVGPSSRLDDIIEEGLETAGQSAPGEEEPLSDVLKNGPASAPQVESGNGLEKQPKGSPETGAESLQPAPPKVVEEEPPPATEKLREEDDEEVFQDAVAEPASSQETASKLGQGREQKRAANGFKSGDVIAKKRPATAEVVAPFRPSARTAAISKRVHAAAKAAEAARESSALGVTSSAFTAATALSKNVVPLSDSTQHARPTTRSGKAGAAVGRVEPSSERPTKTAAVAELPKLANGGLSEPGGGPGKESMVRETRSRSKTVESESEQTRELAGAPATQPKNGGVEPSREDAAEEGPSRRESAEADCVPKSVEAECSKRAEEGRTETFIPDLLRQGEGAEEEGVAGANRRSDIPNEYDRDDLRHRSERGNDRPEVTGSGTGAVQQSTDGVDANAKMLPQPTNGVAEPRTGGSSGEEARPSDAEPELPEGMEVDERNDPQSNAPLQNQGDANGSALAEEEVTDREEDAASMEDSPDNPQKAWEVLEGTVQGEALKRDAPDMTISEFRKRQNLPESFVELVNFWPKKELPQAPASLLTIAVDAGLWSPPPFYRGKRPRVV